MQGIRRGKSASSEAPSGAGDWERAVADLKVDKLILNEVGSITGHKDSGMLMRYTHLRTEGLARKLG